MLGKKHYNNGQKVYELTENTLSYFYKNGNLKLLDHSLMNSWKVSGYFIVNLVNYGKLVILKIKHGRFVRYDKKGDEYDKTFLNGK